MPGQKPNVAVVGGGIGGVAAALALRQRGFEVTIYEQAEAGRETGSGLMLWPNGSRVVRELGLLAAVAERSGASTAFAIRDVNGEILLEIPLGPYDAPARCIRRSDLLAVLLAAFAPGPVRLNHRLIDLREGPAGVRLEFAGGEAVTHDAVVGADGMRSRVRALLFGAGAPSYRGYAIWRGIAAHDGSAIAPGRNSETWGRGERFGLLDTGGGRFTWYATANCEPGRPDAAAGRKAELVARFGHWHAPIKRVIERTAEPEILKHGAYDLPLLPEWGRGRVTLLGDAAHPCTPNLGQGGCLALEDALTLAKCFARDLPVEANLRRYEALRRPRTQFIQRRSRWFGALGQWDDDLLVNVRRLAARALPSPWLDRALAGIYGFKI